MFLDEPRYPVQARTTQASRVSAIEVTAFLNIMRVSFATSLSVFARMNERIQAHWDEIEALSLQNSHYRVVHFLLGLAQNAECGAAAITLPARKAQIGAHLALTPETLSRVFRSLDRDGLIAMHGDPVRIPEIAALRGQLG